MKGNADVMTGLQEAIGIEGTLMLQYFTDERDVRRLGLDLANGLKQLHDQCEEYLKCLTSRLLFLEGAPVLEPKPAATHNKIGDILTTPVPPSRLPLPDSRCSVSSATRATTCRTFTFIST